MSSGVFYFFEETKSTPAGGPLTARLDERFDVCQLHWLGDVAIHTGLNTLFFVAHNCICGHRGNVDDLVDWPTQLFFGERIQI